MLRPTAQSDFLAHDARTIGFKQNRIDSHSRCANSRSESKKFPPANRTKRQNVCEPYGLGLSNTNPSVLSRILRSKRFAILTRAIPRLKAERRDQIDSPIRCGTLRKRSSLQRVGNVEELRTENGIRIGHIDIVEK